MRRLLRLQRGSARYSLLSDGAIVPPFGILGGESGAAVGSYVWKDATITPFPTPGKVGGHLMETGDGVVLQSAGGGGYGDPLEREPARVLDDVVEGYVSREMADALYGVVLDGDVVNQPATAARREGIRSSRVHLVLVHAEETAAYEAVGRGRKRIARLNPRDAAALGLDHDQMLEILADGGAPLRCWARLDATVAADSLPLDPGGLRILRARTGSRVHVRPLHRPPLQ